MFNQESVLFKYPDSDGDAVLIYASREERIGSNVGYDKISFVYSKIRKGSHQGKSFVIECVCEPSNHISAMGFQSQGIFFKKLLTF